MRTHSKICNLYCSNRKKATHYQILSIIFLKEFIELNVNSDTIIKNVKYVELNISIATVTLNTKILKMI